MSKSFDKVWHEGLILKLKSMWISNALLKLIESVLENRFQRVVLNGQTSEWLPIKADFLFFLTAIWLTHGQLWVITEGTASLTTC